MHMKFRLFGGKKSARELMPSYSKKHTLTESYSNYEIYEMYLSYLGFSAKRAVEKYIDAHAHNHGYLSGRGIPPDVRT